MKALRERHGLSHDNDGKRTPLHRLWLNIRNRCNNPRTPDFKYYGGRGIKVCTRWDRFINFAADVGQHPGYGWTLDRRNNDGDYEPKNVRWVRRVVQAQNRKYCVLTQTKADRIRRMYAGGAYTQEALAEKFGCSQGMISRVVLDKAWS